MSVLIIIHFFTICDIFKAYIDFFLRFNQFNTMKIGIGITGASGAIYSKVLLDKLSVLKAQITEIGIVVTENGKENWKIEYPEVVLKDYPFDFYEPKNFHAPFASGSANYDIFIICPTSMGTLGKIANGIADNLITRAADVMLKERKKLILVPRETPYNSIHLRNMLTITEAGGIICPASPSFYSKPQDFETLVSTVIDRILIIAGFEISSFQWGQKG